MHITTIPNEGSPKAEKLEITKRALRPAEAGRRWGLSRAAIYKLLGANAFPSFTLGGPGSRSARLIPIEPLDAYFESKMGELK